MSRDVTSEHHTVTIETRYQIEELLTDYCHTLDDGKWDQWPAFFTEDSVYKIITRDNYDAGLPLGLMYCDGRGMMKDRILALETANIFEPHTYCHTISRPRLDPYDHHIKGRTNFTVVRTMQNGDMNLFATGKYLDTFVTVDHQVMLQERLVVVESRRIDILLVAPL